MESPHTTCSRSYIYDGPQTHQGSLVALDGKGNVVKVVIVMALN